MRVLANGRFLGLAMLLLGGGWLGLLGGMRMGEPGPIPPQLPSSHPVKGLGAVSCASSGCHGSTWPVSGSSVLRNEHRTWSSHDRHARAYQSLLSDRSRLIARNLGLGEAETAKLCLDCHAYGGAARAVTMESSEGVTCESCHGAASHWLGLHVDSDLGRRELGMLDGKSLIERSRMCLSCHLGDSEKSVSHELLAAGHPNLYFELETMSALMPRHWKESDAEWQGVRRLAIGQAVALREAMRLLATRARGASWSSWPDFADFECYSCHHNLAPSGAGFQRRSSVGLGVPRWDSSRYVVFRELLAVVAPASLPRLDGSIADLERHLETALLSREAAARTALEISEAVDAILPGLESTNFNAGNVRRILGRIVSQGGTIGRSGLRSAEQAAMAIDTLVASYQASTGTTLTGVERRVDELFETLQSSSRYDPDRFAQSLKRIRIESE